MLTNEGREPTKEDADMEKTLVKIDRNGSKHYEGMVVCDRCGGNGGSKAWAYTGWTCYKCGGTGKVFATWIERTEEYEAKLAERRKARHAKADAEREEKRKQYEAEQEAKRLAKEAEDARIKAQKAISQFVGTVGEKVSVDVTYNYSAYFTTYIGWMEEMMYIHNFTDENGNVIVWKTTKGIGNVEPGTKIHLTGTVKDHGVYKDEKQTALIRCKIA